MFHLFGSPNGMNLQKLTFCFSWSKSQTSLSQLIWGDLFCLLSKRSIFAAPKNPPTSHLLKKFTPLRHFFSLDSRRSNRFCFWTGKIPPRCIQEVCISDGWFYALQVPKMTSYHHCSECSPFYLAAPFSHSEKILMHWAIPGFFVSVLAVDQKPCPKNFMKIPEMCSFHLNRFDQGLCTRNSVWRKK